MQIGYGGFTEDDDYMYMFSASFVQRSYERNGINVNKFLCPDD